MSNQLNLSLVQTNLHWEDVDANLKHISQHIESIFPPVDIILLPEMFATGFSMRPGMFARESSNKALEQMKQWAKEKSCVVCGSLMFEENGKFYNRLIWLQPDGEYVHYDKRHLFGLGEENKHYTAGNKQVTVELKDWKIRLIVCYDLRFPAWCRNNDDYDLMIVVANWPERRIYAWNQLLIARAIENQSYVAAVNRVGEDRNKIYHNGSSAVVNYKGDVMTTAVNDEAILFQTINKSEQDQFRKDYPFLSDRDEFSFKM